MSQRYSCFQAQAMSRLLTDAPFQTDKTNGVAGPIPFKKNHPEDQKLYKDIIKRKQTVSKFDPIVNTAMTVKRQNYKDFLKRNSIKAVGSAAAVSGAIKQNFKHVLEMNIPQVIKT